MNILHIGLGIRGRHWLEIVRDRSDITSVGCVDPDVAALDWVRTHFPKLRNACYENLAEALARIHAHSAVIASPVSHHGTHCLQALEAGLAILVEKPFTSNMEEALQIVERAERSSKPLVVAQNYRFIPVERTLRQLIRDGRVGTVTSATCLSRRRRPGKGTFLGTMDYPQIVDVGVHHFDSLRSILGLNAVAILCRVNNPPWSDYRHGAITEALIEMETNVSIQYLGTLTSHRDEYSLRIEGDRGVLYTDRKRVWWRKRGSRFFLPVKKVSVPKGDELPYPREGTTSLLDGLKDAVLNRREPETNARDNLQTLAIVEAGKRSAEESRRILVQEVLHQRSPSSARSAPEMSDIPSSGEALA
jgi:predicted dehydrogenase